MTTALASRAPSLAAYIASQVVSMVSDNILWLAVGLWVMATTGDAGSASVSLLMFTLGTLTGPVAGIFVDRVRRRPLIVWINFATALIVLLLPCARSADQLLLVHAVMFGYGVSNAVLGPAHGALLQVIAPVEQLRRLSSQLETAHQIIRFATPLLGSALYALGGLTLVAGLCAAGFVLDSLILMGMRLNEPRLDRPAHGLLRESMAGARHIASTQVLRSATAWLMCVMFAWGIARSSLFSVASGVADGGGSFVALITMAQGLGALGAGICALRWLEPVSDERLIRASVGVVAVGLLLQVFHSPVAAICGALLVGASATLANVALASLYLKNTPMTLTGRTDAAVWFVVFLCQAAAAGIGTLCASAHRHELAMFVTSGALLVFLACRKRMAWPRALPGESR